MTRFIFLLVLLLLPLSEGGNGSWGLLLGLVVLPLLFAWEAAFGGLRISIRLVLTLVAFVVVSLLATTYLYPTLRALTWLVSAVASYVLAGHYLLQRRLGGSDIVRTLVAGALLVALYGLFLYSPNLGRISPETHLYSTFGLHNSCAAFLLLTWPLALALVRREGGYWNLAVCAVLLLGFVLTFSRAAYIAFALQLLMVFGWVISALLQARAYYRQAELARSGSEEGALRRGERPYAALWASLAVVAGLLLILPFTGFYGSVVARIHSIWNLADYSLQGRLTFWSVAFAMFSRFPFFGVGLGNYGFHYTYLQPDWHYYATDAHGIVFKLLAETGLWGTGFALWLAWLCSSRLARAGSRIGVHNRWPQMLMLIGLSGFFAHAQVDFDFTYLANLVYFAVLLAVATSPSAAALIPAVPARPWLSRAAALLAVSAAVMGALHASERRALEMSGEDVTALVRAARVVPWNAATQIDLALAALRATPPDFAKASVHARRAQQLNPYESQPPFLLSQCPPAGSLSERIELGAEAIKLDPFNRPHYYWGLGRLLRQQGDADGERSVLLAAAQRFGEIREPITPEFPRPHWIENNITFASIYLRLAELVHNENARQAKRYAELGLSFSRAAKRLQP